MNNERKRHMNRPLIQELKVLPDDQYVAVLQAVFRERRPAIDQSLIHLLTALPEEQLLAVLQAVFQARQPNPEEAAYNRNAYFLGTASRLLESEEGKDERWGAWKIHAVAYLDREHYAVGAGPDYGFCEFGTCLECGIDVRSNVKHGICPICGEKVYMT